MLRRQKFAREPEILCSLATIAPPQSADIPLALWEEYLKDESSYSSCHDIAAMLLQLCGDGEAVVTRGHDGVRAAQAALGNRNLIILRSAHPTGDGHSVPLFVRDGWVETIEGWAGRTRRDCSPLHACLFNDEAPIWVSTADASRALGQLLADTVDLRLAAWKVLSKAAADGVGVFGNENPVLPLTVTVCPLKGIGTMGCAFRDRLDDTKRWYYRVERARKRAWEVCRHCLAKRARYATWHRCETCKVGYCDTCVMGWSRNPCIYDRCRGTVVEEAAKSAKQ